MGNKNCHWSSIPRPDTAALRYGWSTGALLTHPQARNQWPSLGCVRPMRQVSLPQTLNREDLHAGVGAMDYCSDEPNGEGLEN